MENSMAIPQIIKSKIIKSKIIKSKIIIEI